jgi:hypothetical protein
MGSRCVGGHAALPHIGGLVVRGQDPINQTSLSTRDSMSASKLRDALKTVADQRTSGSLSASLTTPAPAQYADMSVRRRQTRDMQWLQRRVEHRLLVVAGRPLVPFCNG